MATKSVVDTLAGNHQPRTRFGPLVLALALANHVVGVVHQRPDPDRAIHCAVINNAAASRK